METSIEDETGKDLIRYYRGISPLIAREIQYRAKKRKTGRSRGIALFEAFTEVISTAKEERFSPSLYEKKDQELSLISSIVEELSKGITSPPPMEPSSR